MAGYTFVGDEVGETTDTQSQSFVELIYQTADGWMAVSAHTDATWAGLSAAVGRPEWLSDPRFNSVAQREVNKPARLELTQKALYADTTANWMKRLERHDVPCAPVLTRREMFEHPQVRANGSVIEVGHPQAGLLRQARAPAQFSETPIEPPKPARQLGEDTRAVLVEAGLSTDQIQSMIEDGVATEPQDDCND